MVGLVSFEAEACLVHAWRDVHKHFLTLNAHQPCMGLIKPLTLLAAFAYITQGDEYSGVQSVQLR